jgi:hypothetical protein
MAGRSIIPPQPGTPIGGLSGLAAQVSRVAALASAAAMVDIDGCPADASSNGLRLSLPAPTTLAEFKIVGPWQNGSEKPVGALGPTMGMAWFAPAAIVQWWVKTGETTDDFYWQPDETDRQTQIWWATQGPDEMGSGLAPIMPPYGVGQRVLCIFDPAAGVWRALAGPMPSFCYGLLADDLVVNGSTQLEVYDWDETTSAWVDSGWWVLVYAPPTQRAMIPINSWTRADFHAEDDSWYALSGSQTDVILGKLDGALAAGGSATLSIWALTGTSTDWVLGAADSGDNQVVFAPAVLLAGSIPAGTWCECETDADGNYRVVRWVQPEQWYQLTANLDCLGSATANPCNWNPSTSLYDVDTGTTITVSETLNQFFGLKGDRVRCSTRLNVSGDIVTEVLSAGPQVRQTTLGADLNQLDHATSTATVRGASVTVTVYDRKLPSGAVLPSATVCTMVYDVEAKKWFVLDWPLMQATPITSVLLDTSAKKLRSKKTKVFVPLLATEDASWTDIYSFTTITPITTVSVDGTNKLLQYKKTEVWGVETQTEDASPTTFHTGTTC